MSTTLTVLGFLTYVVLAILVVCAALAFVGYVYERATAEIIQTSRARERKTIAHYYLKTSHWFSEFPETQCVLELVAKEILADSQDPDRLRSAWLARKEQHERRTD